jgi:hypothetical protein
MASMSSASSAPASAAAASSSSSSSSSASASAPAGAKAAGGGGAGGGAGAVQRRLQQELMALMTSGAKGVTAFPDGDSMFEWVGTIAGCEGTPYAGLTFKLKLRFPPDYPFSAPTITFSTPIFHPNVDQSGNICLDILKEKWTVRARRSVRPTRARARAQTHMHTAGRSRAGGTRSAPPAQRVAACLQSGAS